MATLNRSQLEVLMVEPSDVQSRIVRAALADADVCNVCSVGDGRSAISEATLAPPDVVVSALHLPDMTAVEMIQEILALPRQEHTSFILISSETRLQQLEPVRQAGAIAILGKPFDEEDLVRALDSVLDLADQSRLNSDASDLSGYRVLVVDDMSMARKHVTRVLRSIGFEHLDQAANGAEAMQCLDQSNYDLVVTDYNMPEMDGCELTRSIRATPALASLPILMVTSEHDDGRLAAVTQAGVSAICDKPFSPAVIKTVVQRALRLN